MIKKDMLYEDLNTFRKTLTEMEEGQGTSTEGIPYTGQDEILGQFIDSAREQFGANFSNTKDPMMYFPQNERNGENVLFRGEIGDTLNNAKFEMTTSGEKPGCFIYTNDHLQLTEDSVELLKVIFGFYKNWKEQLSQMADKKPMSLKANDEDGQSYGQGDMVPGDDYGSTNS